MGGGGSGGGEQKSARHWEVSSSKPLDGSLILLQ